MSTNVVSTTALITTLSLKTPSESFDSFEPKCVTTRTKRLIFTHFWVILSVYWPTMAQMSQMIHSGFLCTNFQLDMSKNRDMYNLTYTHIQAESIILVLKIGLTYQMSSTYLGRLLYRYGNAILYSVRICCLMMILFTSLNSFQSSSL